MLNTTKDQSIEKPKISSFWSEKIGCLISILLNQNTCWNRQALETKRSA